MAMHSVIEIEPTGRAGIRLLPGPRAEHCPHGPEVESVVKVTEGPLRAGTTFSIRQPVMGAMREQTDARDRR